MRETGRLRRCRNPETTSAFARMFTSSLTATSVRKFAVLCALALGTYAASPPSAIKQVSLSRHGCYGGCPSDSVTISSTGTIEYVGFAGVPKLGRYRGRIDAKTYARILVMTARAKLFALPSVFGVVPKEAQTYDVSAKRGSAPTRVDVNDATLAPRPLRDLAGLLSQIRDATPLTSESQINTVVGLFYALPSPDQELTVGIYMTDDTVFRDRGYLIRVLRRVAHPCNGGEPKTDEPLQSAVVIDGEGAISGDGYTITPTATGIRIVSSRETVELVRARYAQAPDLQLHAAQSARCPTTLEIDNNGDVTDARPFLSVVSNVDLDVATVVARAHFQCDSSPGLSIGVVLDDYPPAVGHPEIDLAPTRDLIANTPCRLFIDAGASPKGAGKPAPAAQSVPFYYVPHH